MKLFDTLHLDNIERRKPSLQHLNGVPFGIMIACLALFSFFISCTDPVDDELSSLSVIESFSFHPDFNEGLEAIATGTISGVNITVTVPYNVSTTSLTASFEYVGTSVKVGSIEQVSGITKNNFSNPVTYTVTARDGTKTEYTIIVTKADEGGLNTRKFESFAFHPDFNEDLEAIATGTISGLNITVTVPYDVPTEDLIASFTYTGAAVKIEDTEQISDVTKNDFSNPVIYSVFAEDGSKTHYTVTVTKNIPRIPSISLNTSGLPILDKENYVTSTITIEDVDNYYSNEVTFTGTAGVRGRGNSTWGMPKKPYRIKLDTKAPLLGMSNDKDWALLANYTDKTLLRNITAFEIAKIAEMSWTPASVSVNFYLNNQYQGVYSLTEHVKVSSERLDMELVKSSDNSGEALTGGYLLELDFHYDEPYKFKTDREKLPIMFKDPDEPTTQQFNYVKNYFNQAEQVLYSSNYRDPEEGYRKYIDVESFINYYIVQELAKNVDGNMRGSCYLAIRRNGKIEQPLVWDFDIAFGNANHITWEQGASSVGPEGWFIKEHSPWFDRFFEDPTFVSELKARWNELKPKLDKIPGFIRDHAAVLQEPQARNFSSKSSGGAGWDIHAVMWPNYIDRGSYAEEVNYLVNFVEERLDWLDTHINGL